MPRKNYLKLSILFILVLSSILSYGTDLGTNTTIIGSTSSTPDDLYAIAGSTGLTIQGNSTYTINGNLDLSAATSDFTITVTGGSTLIITGQLISTNTSIKITLNTNSNGYIYIQGGVNVDNNMTFQNDGTIEITGNITVDGTGTQITVNGSGELTINGNLNVGESTTIGSDGILTVHGDITAVGNNSTINANGTINVDGTIDGFPTQNGTVNTKLPIELISFTAHANPNNVELNWATATEINNDFFIVERSVDGINFEGITTITGAGNSLTTVHYSFIDYYPLNGTSYYRIKQTDFDGKYSYTPIVSISSVNSSIKSTSELTSYPNPYKSGDLIVSTKNIEAGVSMHVAITALNGKIIHSMNTTNPENQEINLIPMAFQNLSQGIYIISVTTSYSLSQTKLIVE